MKSLHVFERISVESGKTKNIELKIGSDPFKFYDAKYRYKSSVKIIKKSGFILKVQSKPDLRNYIKILLLRKIN